MGEKFIFFPPYKYLCMYIWFNIIFHFPKYQGYYKCKYCYNILGPQEVSTYQVWVPVSCKTSWDSWINGHYPIISCNEITPFTRLINVFSIKLHDLLTHERKRSRLMTSVIINKKRIHMWIKIKRTQWMAKK